MHLSYTKTENDNFNNVFQVLKDYFQLSDRLITK